LLCILGAVVARNEQYFAAVAPDGRP
jgi:hypothetical protein